MANSNLPIYFDRCDGHDKFEAKVDGIEGQGREILKTTLQYQRDTQVRFNELDRKMDRQHERVTGEIVGLRKAVTDAMLDKARSNGIEFGKAEVTGEIRQGLSRLGTVGKWVLGAVAALAAGGGVIEGIRRLLGG